MDPKQAFCLCPDDRPSGYLITTKSADTKEADPPVCPNCGRHDALVFLQGFSACAACGYSSEGVRGCT
jgi:hypothetical protein